MNIFALDWCPEQSARWLCDQHHKMAVESAQMLCTAHFVFGSSAPYKPCYLNHPCNVWLRKSLSNYRWLVIHGLTICDEYTARTGKIHGSQKVLEWCCYYQPKIPDVGLTPFALAIGEKYQDCIAPNDPIQSYRNFYIADKLKFATWKRNKPWWVK